MHLGPPAPPPGRAWVDEAGVRQFICPICGFSYISDPAQSEAERLDEAAANLGEAPAPDDRVSVCDDCYPLVLERARAAGLIE